MSTTTTLSPNDTSAAVHALFVRRVCGYAELIIGLLALVPNIVVVVAGCKILRKRKMQILVVSMSIADLIFVTTHCPMMFAQFSLNILRGDAACIFVYLATYTTTIASSLSCLLLNINKFLSLYSPLRYRSIATRYRILFSVLACWTISIASAVAFLFSPLTSRAPNCVIKPYSIVPYMFLVVIYYILPWILSLGCSCYIVLVAATIKRRRSQVKRPMVSTASASTDYSDLKRSRPRPRDFSLRSVVFVFSTTVWSAATTLPYRTAMVLRQTDAIEFKMHHYTAFFVMFVIMSATPLGNPFITVLSQRSYLNEIMSWCVRRTYSRQAMAYAGMTSMTPTMFSASRYKSSSTRGSTRSLSSANPHRHHHSMYSASVIEHRAQNVQLNNVAAERRTSTQNVQLNNVTAERRTSTQNAAKHTRQSTVSLNRRSEATPLKATETEETVQDQGNKLFACCS